MIDLHPYDNKERRFHHDDAQRDEGLALVARFLKLPSAPPAARYDMRFYSGGIGIIDHVAIAIAVDHAEALRIALACGYVAPSAASGDWRADLEWLVGADEGVAFSSALVTFIADGRREFQPAYATGGPIWFELESNVNHWGVIWHADGVLAHLAYDQG
ncbi:MAG TPA: hypothetical protein VGL61_36830 [Kofleriaceae bacterium]